MDNWNDPTAAIELLINEAKLNQDIEALETLLKAKIIRANTFANTAFEYAA